VSILVICPSRGRPDAVRELWATMRETTVSPTTRLFVAIDQDDPCRDDYLRIPLGVTERFGYDIDRLTIRVLRPDETGDMTRAMNSAVRPFLGKDLIIGMVNDDHRFRTRGWDRRVVSAMKQPGIVAANDGFQEDRLVTTPFIDSRIVTALGWYCLPACRHLFVDNAWTDLGKQLRRLWYLKDVVIEHMHPFAGKGQWDDRYEAANNQAVIDHDRTAYEAWRGSALMYDVQRIKRALR
jgi:hypothetical protein